MSDPYRSLPEKEFAPYDDAVKRANELERDNKRLQDEIAHLTREHAKLEGVADRYRKLVFMDDEARAREKAEWAERLATYESRYGSVDLVSSMRVELQQLKYAYAAALARIVELEKNR